MEIGQHLPKSSWGSSSVSLSPAALVGTCRQRMGSGQKNPRSAEPSGVPGLGIEMYASGSRVDWHEAGQGNSVALMLRFPVDVDCSEPEGLEGACGVSHVGISQPPAPNQWTVASLLQLTHASSGTLTQAHLIPWEGPGPLCRGFLQNLPDSLSSLCPLGPCRYFSGDAASLFPSSPSLAVPYPSVTASPASLFIPTPPGFLPLTKQQLFRSPHRVSPSSLPGRLSRALSLGTIPSLTRTGKTLKR